MSGVIVNYNNNALTSMSSSGTKTLLTSGKYCEGDFEVVYSEPTTSSLTATPTETTQTFNATSVYGYKPVTVNAISSTYIGTGVAKKSSADTTFVSTTGTFTAPVGYYSTAATKTITTQAAATIYPSTADQYISSYRWLTGSQTIKSVTTSNLTAANIASGVTVKVGDANNASRISQVTGTYVGDSFKSTFTLYPPVGYATFNGLSSLYSIYYNGSLLTGANATINAGEPITILNNSSLQLDVKAEQGGIPLLYGSSCDYYAGPIDMYLSNTNFTSKRVLDFVLSNYISSPIDFYDGFFYKYFGSSVTIPSRINKLGMNAFYNTPKLSYVYGNNVQVISQQCFMYNYYLVSVYFPNAITMGNSAFARCSELRTVSFPKVDQIGENGFASCYSLSTVYFPKCRTIYSNAFAYCSSLKTVDFPECKYIHSSAFYACIKLTTLSFPECISINYYAFTDCSSLSTVNFPKCISISNSAFNSCSALTTAYFPECTLIGASVFKACYNLSDISFPKCTSIYMYAFYLCSALTTAYFPECTSIGTYAFGSCSSLANASFPKCTFIGSYAFTSCYSLSDISFSKCISIGQTAFGSCSALTMADFPECTNIGSYAFMTCISLTDARFPKCSKTGRYAFSGCTSLMTVSLPICQTFESGAFYSCNYLLSLYLNQVSSIPTYGVSMFSYTPIVGYNSSVAGGYGSIFVPSSLYEEFKVANGWSAHSSRIVSV